MVLCWATFIAILGRMYPMGHRLDTPALEDEIWQTEGDRALASGP